MISRLPVFLERLPFTRAGRQLARDIRLLESSTYFDAAWYQQGHAATSGFGRPTGAAHYLLQGANAGLDPGPLFSTQDYLSSHPDVAQAGMNPLVHFLRYGQYEGRFPRSGNNALGMDEMLWSGQAVEPARLGLRSILADAALPEPERIYAAWALARWHGARGEWSEVEPLLTFLQSADARYAFLHALPLVEVDALIRSGNLVCAGNRLDALVRQFPGRADFLLAQANRLTALSAASADRLACINALYAKSGLAELRLINQSSALIIDNLQAETSSNHIASADEPPLVTILVPAFNAESTLPTALECLARQTWKNLEVLIIDDASTDSTATIAEAFSRQDARFRLLRTSFSEGAYAARNLGLAESRGEFITVHDADDWSHPSKIALQVEALLNDMRPVASVSHWVRCTDEMWFGGWRIEEGWVQCNVSSLMLRRQVFDALGYWDRVKVAADTEYYYRLFQAYGEGAVVEVKPGLPLSFGRLGTNSLTGSGETHERTALGGVRKLYMDAAFAWQHQSKSIHDLYLPARPEHRSFPIPPALRVTISDWPGEVAWRNDQRGILLVAHAASSQIFGAERCLLDVLRGLVELRTNVVVALPEADNQAYLDELRLNACHVFVLPNVWWRQDRQPTAGVIANFRQLLSRFDCDLLYANTLVLSEPLLAARQADVRTLLHVHELPEHDPDLCAALGAGPEQIRDHVLQSADRLVANSHLVANWLNAPERTVIVPNTLDFERFDLPARNAAGPFNVAMLSSNLPKKGILDFVELARQLSGAGNKRIECLLVGPDNGHVAALRQAQKRRDIPDNLRFFGMAADPLTALAEADVVVSLSHCQESFGRVVLEAMAARRPVVCYDWGALPELVAEGETGFMVPYGNVSAIAERVRNLASDPALRRAMGEAGRKRAMKLYGWRIFLERLQCSINPFQG